MTEIQNPAPTPKSHRSIWRRIFLWASISVAALLTIVFATVAYVAHNAEPILRQRVIDTLSARFNSPVELDKLQISVAKGLQVSGEGLRIFYIAGPNRPDADPEARTPMLNIRSFQFRTGIRQLFEPTTRVVSVHVQGMSIHIPPAGQRPALMPTASKKPKQPRIAILVDEILCTDTELVLETTKPGKVPLTFEISNLTLKDVGATQPFTYHAVLVNPKPRGNIDAIGHFGPWHSDEPRDTPIDGKYSFTHADLDTIKGLGGILSSTGSYAGSLNNIVVDGTTETPNFSLDVTDHPVDLRTQFHAIVDGTTGDTTLAPVHGQFLHSSIIATGSITRTKGVPGHTIDLQTQSIQARIEDMLRLGVKATPPLMSGALTYKAHIFIPPGPESVSRKMHLQGSFNVQGATFSNPNFQQTVDKLSERAQGHPHQANAQDAASVTSSMSGNFNIADRVTKIAGLDYQLPGAHVRMDGQYSLDGNTLDFHGTVRTDATASQMTTGWKSLLLRPFDGLLKKDGAGLEVPINIKGTRDAPKFGVDFNKMTFGRHDDKQPPPMTSTPHR
jgi:hypothetical protein